MSEEKPEIVDDNEIGNSMPSMNVSIPETKEKEDIVTGDELISLYKEVLGNLRADREQAEEALMNFMEMVFNSGDSSSASKEALVNLIKFKGDTADKMSKIADLMTRIVLKDRDTFPKYLAATQNNTVKIETSKRQLIQGLQKKLKQKQKKG